MPVLTIPEEDGDDAKMTKIIFKCMNDPGYFISNFCMIDSEEEGMVPFTLWPKQKELLDMFLANRLIIALKSRQIGISWLAAAYALWLCVFHSNKNVVVISYNEQVANEFVAKATFMYDNLPLWLKPALYKRNDSLLHFARFVYDGNIRVLKGRNSRIQGFARTERTGRFMRASLLIFDEAAHIPEMDTLLVAALGSLATSRGKCFMISTAFGMGNAFHKVYKEAGVRGKQYFDFAKMFLGWRTNPDRDDTWYEETQRLFGDECKQEFPDNEDEAFIATGACFFPSELLAERIKKMESNPKPCTRGNLAYDPGTPGLEKPQFTPSSDGDTIIWEPPYKGTSYVIGCDVAEGLEKGDNSVFYVMNSHSSEIVAEFCTKISPDQLAFQLRAAAIYYQNAFIGVEANNHGLTTLKYLTDPALCNYGNIYFREVQDELLPEMTRKLGWFTSGSNRRTMLDAFSHWWRDDKIKTNSVDLLYEMQRFTKDSQGRPSARGFDLDDRVMAMALTLQMHFAQQGFGAEEIDEDYSKDARRRQALETYKNNVTTGIPCMLMIPDGEELEDLENVVL